LLGGKREAASAQQETRAEKTREEKLDRLATEPISDCRFKIFNLQSAICNLQSEMAVKETGAACGRAL
jgi:hypothetical protein